MDMNLLIIGEILLILMFVILLITSDQSTKYRIISVAFSIPILIFVPIHLLSDTLTDFVDVTTHIFLGLSIFLTISNVKFFEEKNRYVIGIIGVIIIILLIELQLFLLGTQPLDIDMLDDVLWTIIGSIGGVIIFALPIVK